MATYWLGSAIDGNSASKAAYGVTGKAPIQHSPPIADDVGTVLSVTSTLQVASGTNFTLNDVVEWCVLPADHVPVDWVLSSDQQDSNAAPTFAVTIGVMTGTVGDATRTSGGNFAGTPEGVASMPFGKGLVASPQYARNGVQPTFANTGFLWQRVAPSATADRSIGMFIQAIAATSPATVRRMDFTLFYKIAAYGQ
jgi:hypothetical protein